MDTISKDHRSWNMSRIRSSNTKIEVEVRSWLFKEGFRFRKNDKRYPGKPDVVLPKYKTVIFVNGCFWHRHEGCKYAYMPKSRVEFWQKKFESNIKRDLKVKQELADMKVKQLVVWECTIKETKKDGEFQKKFLEQIICFLNSEKLYKEI